MTIYDVYVKDQTEPLDVELNNTSEYGDAVVKDYEYSFTYIVTNLAKIKVVYPVDSYMYLDTSEFEIELHSTVSSDAITTYLSVGQASTLKESFESMSETLYLDSNIEMTENVKAEFEDDQKLVMSCSCDIILTNYVYLYEMDDYALSTFDSDTLFDNTYKTIE